MRNAWHAQTALLIALLAPAAGAQRVGTPAPEIDFPTQDGGRAQLSKLRGHPVIVTFWGTWCPPCRVEFPQLVEAYRKHHDQGLEVIAVDQTKWEKKKQDVQAFVDEFGVTFPVALDQHGKTNRSYRLIGLPTTMFIDTGGVVRHIHIGPPLGPDDIAKGLATILPKP